MEKKSLADFCIGWKFLVQNNFQKTKNIRRYFAEVCTFFKKYYIKLNYLL